MDEATDTLLAHAPREYKEQWLRRLEWYLLRHPFQLAPAGDWYGWMIRAGRGAGKTRTGAEDVADYCGDNPGYLYAIVTATFGDGRDVAVEGESGVLSVLDRRGIAHRWNRSNGELFFENGAEAKVYSSEKPDRLRGPQFHRAWCDELASWKDAWKGDILDTTWNNLMMALRLGDDPRCLITTTPRQVKLVKELIADPDVVETRGSTYDNRANLAGPMLKRILRYEGTRIGRQEVHGEMIEDVEGAHWTLEMIDRARLEETPDLARVVVGVDPPGGVTEAGIVAAGLITSPCPCGLEAEAPHFAVLADGSLKAAPEGWGRRVGTLYDDHGGDKVAAERNFGGDMVEATIRNVRPDLTVTLVNASRGKSIRAEPISALYGQHPDDLAGGTKLDPGKWRVHHVDAFTDLEEEMTTWTDDVKWSPNRMDALVWALTMLSTTRKRKWSAR